MSEKIKKAELSEEELNIVAGGIGLGDIGSSVKGGVHGLSKTIGGADGGSRIHQRHQLN